MGRVSAQLAHHALMLVRVALRKPNPPNERGTDVMALVNAVDSSGMFKIVCGHCHFLGHALLQTLPPTLAAPIPTDNWLPRKHNERAMSPPLKHSVKEALLVLLGSRASLHSMGTMPRRAVSTCAGRMAESWLQTSGHQSKSVVMAETSRRRFCGYSAEAGT